MEISYEQLALAVITIEACPRPGIALLCSHTTHLSLHEDSEYSI